MRHAEIVGERGLLALATTGRAELMAERSQLAQARQELERAERWAIEAGDEVGRAEVERVRALVAYKDGDLDGALAAAESALATARTYDSAVLAAECAALLALTLRRLGRSADAEERRDEALAGFERLGAERLRERFEEDWSAASSKRRRADSPRGAARARAPSETRAGRTATAFFCGDSACSRLARRGSPDLRGYDATACSF